MVKRVNSRHRPDQVALPHRPEVVDELPRVEQTHESGFVVREQLSTLIAARKKPPSLKMAQTVAANESVSGELSPEGLALLGDIRGDVLAYHITELSYRLGQLDHEELTVEHKRGIASVSQLTRMFEHLHIMRTSQPVQ